MEFVSDDGVRDKDSTKIEVERGYKDLGFDDKVLGRNDGPW
jgi:hypothetical protein